MLSKKQEKIIDNLRILANDTPGCARARMVAAIVYKNQVISYGFNERKTHPFVRPFQKNDEAIYLHAETAAIKNALKRLSVEQLSRCDLYIVRSKTVYKGKNKFDQIFGMAKPCSGCQKCIQSFGLRKVFYSTDAQDFEEA